MYLLTLLKCTGFQNMKVIENRIVMNHIKKPTLIKLEDTKRMEIIELERWRNENLRTGQIGLYKPTCKEDFDASNGRGTFHPKEKNFLGNFDVYSNLYEKKKIISDAEVIWAYAKLGGLYRYANVDSEKNEVKHLYINNIRISKNIADMQKILDNVKNTYDVAKLIDVSEVEGLKRALGIREYPDNRASILNIPGTDYSVMTQYYITNGRKSRIRLRVELLKKEKAYKCLYNNITYNANKECPPVINIAIKNNEVIIEYHDGPSILINIA